MYQIKTFNKISPVGLGRFDPELYTVSDSCSGEDAIVVRSAKLLDYAFPSNLLAIARAGAGVNNIPLDRCSQAGIAVFNTPGANANAVKELVLCAMLIGSRDVDGAIRWVRDQVDAGIDVTTVVEKGKSAFIGPEIYKKTLGVIGLGAIGSLVANVALDMGMDVYGYDPFLSVDAALRLMCVVVPVVMLLDILWSLVTALIGAYMLASGFEGFFFRWSLKWFERPLMILGAVMLIVPGMVTDLVGIAIIVVEFVTEFMFKRSEKFVPVTVSQSTT